ncbi:hypothetical protein BH11ACT8_BH11ACT8_29920 [soil metagenome]
MRPAEVEPVGRTYHPNETVVGTWDGATVIRTSDAFHAEDADGTTLWTSAPLRHRTSSLFLFHWTDTVVATEDGPLMVRYDFVGPEPVPTTGEQPDATRTLLDAGTGEPTRNVGVVTGANFRWLVGDVAMFVRGDYVATYEGYRLP